jgi:hypothetical protein
MDQSLVRDIVSVTILLRRGKIINIKRKRSNKMVVPPQPCQDLIVTSLHNPDPVSLIPVEFAIVHVFLGSPL